MTLATRPQMAKAVRNLKLAEQNIRKVLKLANEHEKLLNIERNAELEATCVILMRAQSHIITNPHQAD